MIRARLLKGFGRVIQAGSRRSDIIDKQETPSDDKVVLGQEGPSDIGLSFFQI